MLLIIIILKQCKLPASKLRLTIVLLLILFEIPSPEIPDGGGIILYIAAISQY